MIPIPAELLYLLVALALGLALYRYFTGRGGTQIIRTDYAGLPDEGHVDVHHHEVRWKGAEGDSFVAAWPLDGGRLVVMRVVFDEADEEEPDLGHIDISIGAREAARDVAWTEKIRDRTLRTDVEAILAALAREAKVARSDLTRLAGAKPVGDDRASGQYDEDRS